MCSLGYQYVVSKSWGGWAPHQKCWEWGGWAPHQKCWEGHVPPPPPPPPFPRSYSTAVLWYLVSVLLRIFSSPFHSSPVQVSPFDGQVCRSTLRHLRRLLISDARLVQSPSFQTVEALSILESSAPRWGL